MCRCVGALVYRYVGVLMVDDMVDVNEAHLCVDCSVRREMRPLDIVSLPGYERLTASEKEVCA